MPVAALKLARPEADVREIVGTMLRPLGKLRMLAEGEGQTRVVQLFSDEHLDRIDAENNREPGDAGSQGVGGIN